MVRNLLAIFAGVLLVSSVFGAPPEGWQDSPNQSKTVDDTTYIDANDILMFVTNHGNFGRDLAGVFGYDAGTFFPFTTTADIEAGVNTTYVQYAAGLWAGGLVNGQVRVAIAEYNDEYVPGPMQDGLPMPDNPAFRVYKLYHDSLADNPNNDYDNWPIDQGAPVNPDGSPAMMGDKMTWAVYNDADEIAHTNDAGETDPLGLEIRQTTFAVSTTELDTAWLSQEVVVTPSAPSPLEVVVFTGEPQEYTGHDYAVEVWSDDTPANYWRLVNTTTATILLNNQTDFSGDSAYNVGEGFSFRIRSSEAAFQSFQVVANASGPLDPPEAGAFFFSGFPVGEVADVDGYPTDGQQLGAGKWGLHTADNGGTGSGGTRESYEDFLLRVLRGTSNMAALGWDDYEMRFTGSPDNPGVGGSYGIKFYQDESAIWVPFELWNIGSGTPNDPSDDYQMYCYVMDDAGDPGTYIGDGVFSLESWGVSAFGGGDLEHSCSGDINDPFTDWIYWRKPVDQSPGTSGYEAIEAQILAGTYEGLTTEEVMARTVLVNWNGDEYYDGSFNQDCPELGTVFRITTLKGWDEVNFAFTPHQSPNYTVDVAGATVFIRYRIFNKSASTIEDCHFSLWSDPDLGGLGDDLTGCDTLLDLGFCYNGAPQDAQYGLNPPCFGYRVLQGPLFHTGNDSDSGRAWGELWPGYTNFGMTAFAKYLNGTDPNNYQETFNYMQGLQNTGAPYVYDGNILSYMHSGDPVTGTGDLDVNLADRRMMITTGPITMNSGDSTEIYLAMMVGRGNDHLAAVDGCRADAVYAKMLCENGFPTVPTEPTLGAGPMPSPFLSMWQNAIEPVVASLTLGYLEGGGEGEAIDVASISIPSIPVIDSIAAVPAYSGYDGQVLRIFFDGRPFVAAHGSVWGVINVPTPVNGNLVGGEPFGVVAAVPVAGHIPGDLNADGVIDMGDLVGMVHYMFQQGPAPHPVLLADVDGVSGIDVADLVYLVMYMYHNGPPPIIPQN